MKKININFTLADMNNLIQNLLTSSKSTSSAQLTILLFNRSKAMVVAGQQPPTVCTAYNTILAIVHNGMLQLIVITGFLPVGLRS